MELFHSSQTDGDMVLMSEEESQHCIKVLRHKTGDEIDVIDGAGTLLHCRLTDASPKHAAAQILERTADWGSHPYELEMAVCPTKNIDRYEWFVEKACEIGLDTLVPVAGDHSERKVVKPQRLCKILLSATKQSLKARIPELREMLTVKEFIQQEGVGSDTLKLIAYCFEDEETPRTSIQQALRDMPAGNRKITILIGPEGDFSKEEAELAIRNGFIPIHLGPSRLRTETAALTAVMAVYSRFQL